MNSFHILLIEPNPDEISPFIDAFESTKYTDEVQVISDSDAAFDLIHQRGAYADVSWPDLILLDIHVSDGEKILEKLKQQPQLGRTPVLVVTASNEAEDVARSYDLNANAYLQKPSTPDEFEDLAEAIEGFWLRVVQIPPE